MKATSPMYVCVCVDVCECVCDLRVCYESGLTYFV